jgi:hypothetical protein
VGDLRWDGRVWRRWSGHRWSTAAYSLHPERLTRQSGFDREPQLSQERRDRALQLAVEDQITSNAAVVVFDGPTGVITGYRRPVTHLVHAVLTAITLGLWAVIWLVQVLDRREDRVQLEVDAWGNVWARGVKPA